MDTVSKLPLAVIHKWKNKILSGKKINYFLLGILPFIYEIEEHVNGTLKSCPGIGHWFDQEALEDIIYTQSEVILIPIILPSFVLEMHVAKEEQLLLGRTSQERFLFFIHALLEDENHKALLSKYPLM